MQDQAQDAAPRKPNTTRKRRRVGEIRTAKKTVSLPLTTIERLAAFVEHPVAGGMSESYHMGEALDRYMREELRRAARATD